MNNKTVLEALVVSLARAADHNSSAEVAPAAILWTDEQKLWQPLLPALKAAMPNLFVLGEWRAQEREGPPYWLKCVIARVLPDIAAPEGQTPVIYLPGVSRSTLRQVNICPPDLQPLAELQFRGAFWSQANGKDWTPFAFLSSQNGGLDLDVAQDEETRQALKRALPQVAGERVLRFEGKRVDADELVRLLDVDLSRDILVWMSNPQQASADWDSAYWAALCSQAIKRLKLDPTKDDSLTAAEKLAARDGEWKAVWSRFCETPARFSGVVALLERLPPPTDLFADKEPYAAANHTEEVKLEHALLAFAGKTDEPAARKRLLSLDEEHARRRKWVWAELGRSPLARASEHLARIATLTAGHKNASTPADMQAGYEAQGWEIDAAMVDALACAQSDAQTRAVEAALISVYKPWLEAHAESFQSAVKAHAYPLALPPKAMPGEPGLVIFFVDGLRYDAGRKLAASLVARRFDAVLGSVWTTIPSVTASGKVLASPAAVVALGEPDDANFEPKHKVKRQPLNAPVLRKTLEEMGWQVLLNKAETGDPSGKAWVETGDLDQYGHDNQLRLAKDLGKQLNSVLERIEQLLAAGWKRVRVVTDHGWLLVPGKLDKVQLQRELTETTWGRAAKLKPGAHPPPLTFPWTWCDEVQIALAPGAKSFKAGEYYSHGGLSLQESLTPVLEITGAAAGITAKVTGITWHGLRLRIEAETNGRTFSDLRTQAGNPESSIAKSMEELEGGKAALVVEDDGLAGSTAMLVLLDQNGQVLDKQAVEIGG